MRRTEAHQGVRMIKFRSVFDRYEASDRNQIEAAELSGAGERTFRRWCVRFEVAGESGLLDRRLGRVPSKRVPADSKQEIERLYRTRYKDFTAKHFISTLSAIISSLTGTHGPRRFCNRGTCWSVPRSGAHRRKRLRRPIPGMMLHQDGSRHEWIAGLDPMDLIVTMDDAPSVIYLAFLLSEEGTASTFQALLEVFGKHRLPLSLYTDHGSHYFYTPEAGGKVDRTCPTQVGRALAHLGVEPTTACSPEARGRSERLCHTLQDRLVKELVLAGITKVEAANRFMPGSL